MSHQRRHKRFFFSSLIPRCSNCNMLFIPFVSIVSVHICVDVILHQLFNNSSFKKQSWMEFSTVEKKDDIVSSSLSLIYACMHMILTLNHNLLHCESSHSVIIHITPNISTVQIASVPPAFLSHVFVLVL